MKLHFAELLIIDHDLDYVLSLVDMVEQEPQTIPERAPDTERDLAMSDTIPCPENPDALV